MTAVTQKNAQDASVSAATPNTNHNSLNRLFVHDGTFAYLFFARVFPMGARILSAKLRVRNGEAWAGTVGMACHRVSAPWSANKVTYNSRPATAASQTFSRYLTKTNAPKYTIWEFDVTAVLQAVSDGSIPWYGFQVDANGTSQKWLHSTQSFNQNAVPELYIEWSDAPNAPTGLSPGGGNAISVAEPILRFGFVDVSGNTSMAAYQVQVHTSSDFSAPAFDTGEVASSIPQCDLSTTTFTEVPAGATAWWRVRVKDGAGLWSDWSVPVSFTRVLKPTLTLNNPPSSGVVTDSTPPILWDLSTTQERYRVQLSREEDGKMLWDSGEVTSASEVVTPPAGLITGSGIDYQVRVQSWDAVDREATPGDAPFLEVVRTFQFTPSSTVAGVSGISVVKDGSNPWHDVSFTSTEAPDSFTVLRDNVVVASNLLPSQLTVNGTTYTWRDMKVSGRTTHTWKVLRVVNGVASSNNPTATGEAYNVAPLLHWMDGSNIVQFMNPVVDPGLSEESSVLYPNGAPPVLVSQSQWGYVGSFQGELASDVFQGLSAQELRRRLLAIRRQPGTKCMLLWADEAIECYVYGMKITPITYANKKTEYAVSFNFIQQDYT